MTEKTPLERRKFKEVIARKPNECRLCPSSWKEGDAIFIMSDPFTDTFELVCRECRSRVADLARSKTEGTNA